MVGFVDTSNDANPYQSPREVPDAGGSPVCNFCGKPSKEALVQAPGQDVYICGACARIAIRAIESHEVLTSLPRALSFLGLGVFVLALVSLNWFLWDDMADVGPTISIIGGLAGAAALVYAAAVVRYRCK